MVDLSNILHKGDTCTCLLKLLNVLMRGLWSHRSQTTILSTVHSTVVNWGLIKDFCLILKCSFICVFVGAHKCTWSSQTTMNTPAPGEAATPLCEDSCCSWHYLYGWLCCRKAESHALHHNLLYYSGGFFLLCS